MLIPKKFLQIADEYSLINEKSNYERLYFLNHGQELIPAEPQCL